MNIRNLGLALATVGALGSSPDGARSDRNSESIDTAISEEITSPKEGIHGQTLDVLSLGDDENSQEAPKMALAKAEGILFDLKKTHPEVEKAGMDEAIISAVQTLGEGFGEFYDQFGTTGILTLAASLYFLSRKPKKSSDFNINEHPEVKAQLDKHSEEAREIAGELDELVMQKNPSQEDKERLFARAAALASAMILTIAPATANASGLGDVWDGAKNAYHGVTHGVGEILNTFGRLSEALGAIGYAIDIIAVLVIILGGMITADDFAKAWKALSNNHIRRDRSLDRLVGPRKRKHILFIPTGNTKAGISTELLERKGTEPGDNMARNAGTVLRDNITRRLPTELKPFNRRIRDGEIDIGSLNGHTEQLNELKTQILEILDRDYVTLDPKTGLPENEFPQREYDELIARFNTLVGSLKSSVEPVGTGEKIKWKGIGAISAYILISSISIGWLAGSSKAHIGGAQERSGQPSSPSENSADPYDLGTPSNPEVVPALPNTAPKAPEPTAPTAPTTARPAESTAPTVFDAKDLARKLREKKELEK